LKINVMDKEMNRYLIVLCSMTLNVQYLMQSVSVGESVCF